MPKNNPIQVSIVIVNFHTVSHIKKLLQSIQKHTKNTQYQIIVVDNQPSKSLEKFAKTNKKTQYINPQANLGYSTANNLGSTYAIGDYLFFLNPDTTFQNDILAILSKYLESHPNVAAVAPTLLDTNNKPYQKQGTSVLTPLKAIFSLSFLHRIWPNNPIAKTYWQSNLDRTKPYVIDILPGTAFLIRKSIFNQLKGFDPQFFLYFEESDLFLRLLQKGQKSYIHPKARLVHQWGESTKSLSPQSKETIFSTSRYHYFNKHFGTLWAVFVETILSLNFHSAFFLFILILAAIPRFYRLDDLMPFIGDFGRDFLVADNMAKQGQIPLLGIPSSVPRFKQGPLYIWFLGTIFFFTNTSIHAAGLFAATLGFLAVGAVFIISNHFFSRFTAKLSALILATSPFAILESRSPFHTNAIPLFSGIYLCSLLMLLKHPDFLFWSALSFALLFQFELVAAPLFLLIPLVWFLSQRSFNSKFISHSILGVSLGLFPQIIYDLTHNFAQLATFVAWIGYRIASFVGLFPEHTTSSQKITQVLYSIFSYLQRFFSWGYSIPTILLTSFILIQLFLNYKQINHRFKLILLWILIMLASFIIIGNASQAYFPILFLPISITTAWAVKQIKKSLFRLTTTILIISLGITNLVYTHQHDYFLHTPRAQKNNPFSTYGLPLSQQTQITHIIASLDQPVRLATSDPGGHFDSYLANYHFHLTQSGVLVSDRGVPVWINSHPHSRPPFDSINYKIGSTTISLPF